VFDDSTLIDVLFPKFEIEWGVLRAYLVIKPSLKV